MNPQPLTDQTSTAPTLLLVEDESLFAKAAAKRLERAGYRCRLAGHLAEARALVTQHGFDAILLDLRLPDGNGLEWLPELAATSTPVVVLSAYGDIADAVQAMKQGAADYLRKPLDLAELAVTVDQVLQHARMRSRLQYSREREESQAGEIPTLIGDSRATRMVREQLERLANLDRDHGPRPMVLITGETGTGKDLAARWLHWWSSSGRPFVHVDCASLPRELIEAELFGHERGAYTGASAARSGLIEAAEDGTLFLDEIAELPLDLQAKLLHVLECRSIRRVGSVRQRSVAASFVAASNRDLPALVQQGLFRTDLYYRLNVISIAMPPLRDRPEDIAPITRHFVGQLCRCYGLAEPAIEPAVVTALAEYHWPGNVRELKHVLERALLLGHGGRLRLTDLVLPSASSTATDSTPALRATTLADLERQAIDTVLRESAGNVSKAARRLGVSRMTLRYRMEKHQLGGGSEES